VQVIVGTAHLTLPAIEGKGTGEFLTYPEWLLESATRLLNEGQHEVAIVTSVMACEIAAEQAFASAFLNRGLGYLEAEVSELLNGYNLGNVRIRKLYNALTGDTIEQQQFWQAYVEATQRRNAAIHRGKRFNKPEAELSKNAAAALVSYLK
jgi:hypothetical protein